MAKTLCEISTSRLLTHIVGDDKSAIVSPYRSEYSDEENKRRMTTLKHDVRNLGYGYTQFVSRWVEDGVGFDEQSLLIPNISKEDALKLGKQFEQSSVIVKDGEKCDEICTKPFEKYSENEVVRSFNLSGDNVLNIKDAEEIFAKRKGGPASKSIKGTAKAFHLAEVYELEQPRASYFQTGYTKKKIYEDVDDITVSEAIEKLNKLK